jgi:hypothetical protein
MAEFLPPVILEIQAKATQAIASMQTVNGELDKMETKAIKAGGSLDVMTKASRYAGTALLGIAGVLGTVGAMSIKAALGVATSQAKLQTAVQDTGVSFQTFTPYMNQSVDSMAKLGFTASDTMDALASMTAATRNPQTAINNLAVVADLAAFKQESLAAAADTVSRATLGQARGLADLGLAIGKTIPKGADLATITQMIETRTKGAAAAAANANPWKVLTTQFQALGEQLGIALLPAFKNLVNWISGPGLNGLKAVGKWIGDNKGLFEGFVAVLATIWVVPKVAGIISSIKLIQSAYESLRAVLITTGIAEAFATAGVSVGSATVALAGAAAAGYLITQTPKISSLLNGGGIAPGTKMPSNFAASGAGSNYKIAGLPALSKFTAPSISSGLSPAMISSTTKSKAAKGTTLAQQKAGIMGGGGALTLTVTTDSGAVVKSITGSAGTTKVVVKK